MEKNRNATPPTRGPKVDRLELVFRGQLRKVDFFSVHISLSRNLVGGFSPTHLNNMRVRPFGSGNPKFRAENKKW